MRTVLIADDDHGTRAVLTALLKHAGYSILACAQGEEALKVLGSQRVDLVITDLVMEPGMSGMDLLRNLRRDYPQVPVIMITGYSTVDAAVGAMREGAFDFVRKPVRPRDLLAVVRAALQKEAGEDASIFASDEAVPRHFGGLIGGSEAMQKLYRRLQQVARTEAPVQIHGEPGTEVEQVARALHSESSRADAPLFVVDFDLHQPANFQAVISDEFATEPMKKGKKYQPSTLLLKNTNLMPAGMQMQLAGLITRKKALFEPEPKEGTVPDVRFIAATEHDLKELAKAELFNSEAAFFLSMLTLELPPLRNRREDIPALVQHYMLHQAASGYGRMYSVTVGAMQLLCRYSWPGNGAELYDVLGRAMKNATGMVITIGDLAEFISDAPGQVEAPGKAMPGRGAMAQEYLREQEKKYTEILQGLRKGKPTE